MYSKKEIAELKKDFWESFNRYTTYYSFEVDDEVKWIYYRTGISGVELKFDVEKKVCRVVMEVNTKDEMRRLEIYEDLEAYKALIDDGFRGALEWESDYFLKEGKSVARIYIEQIGLSYYNRNNWPEIFKFMAKNMYRLQTNVLDVLDILREKYGK